MYDVVRIHAIDAKRPYYTFRERSNHYSTLYYLIVPTYVIASARTIKCTYTDLTSFIL